MPNFILKINHLSDEIYNNDNISCYLLNSTLDESFVQNFDAKNKPLLLQGDNAPELCKKLNTAGVVYELDVTLPTKVQINKIREIIGTKKILGVIIPPRRHEAMLVSETEPEFVAFRFASEDKTKAEGLIAWYNELFLIQSALDLSDGLQDISSFDTDFVIINSTDYKDFGC